MTEFTEEEKALYERCPEKIRRFVGFYWKYADTESYDAWRHSSASIHGAAMYESGESSVLLVGWYEFANKRAATAIKKEAL